MEADAKEAECPTEKVNVRMNMDEAVHEEDSGGRDGSTDAHEGEAKDVHAEDKGMRMRRTKGCA